MPSARSLSMWRMKKSSWLVLKAAGRGLDRPSMRRLHQGKRRIGVDLHEDSRCLAEDGQIAPVYSISAGLDYPAGPNMISLKIPSSRIRGSDR